MVATGSDRVASPVMGARKALTSGTRLPEREIARERGGVRLTGGAELAAAEGRGARARGRWAAWAARGAKESAGTREREGVWAGNGPAEGGVFPFSFSIFYFYSFLSTFLLNNNYLNNLRC